MILKFWFFRHYWWILPLIFAISMGAIYLFGDIVEFKVSSALLGTTLSIMYFTQKQKLEEAKLFREIFEECNSRYDKMNSPINEILNGLDEESLSEEQIDLLNNYFNLCGEEYLYYLQGYIYPSVWEAWLNGMKFISNNNRIAEHWKNEKISGSFYNLPL